MKADLCTAGKTDRQPEGSLACAKGYARGRTRAIAESGVPLCRSSWGLALEGQPVVPAYLEDIGPS